jgi:formylglycine-generating enzyme required for sulfatase activity
MKRHPLLILLVSLLTACTSWTATPAPTSTHTNTPISTKTEVLPTSTPYGPTQVSRIDGMNLMYAPAGKFLMGWIESDGNENIYLDSFPRHQVYVDAFWIDQTEITNGMFAAFLATSGYLPDPNKRGLFEVSKPYNEYEVLEGADWLHPEGPGTNITGKENYPVVQVSWYDAQAYCTWVGRRLPTEAEWEKAARGTDGRWFPWGNITPTCRMNLDPEKNECNLFSLDNVGCCPSDASPYGAMDMAANAFEWVSDWYQHDYYASQELWNNPQGPSFSEYDSKVVRGGNSHYLWPTVINPIYRNSEDPTSSYFNIGFRCAYSP